MIRDVVLVTSWACLCVAMLISSVAFAYDKWQTWRDVDDSPDPPVAEGSR